ncbi:hypothetical protein D3C72_915740 [compost metagenome]
MSSVVKEVTVLVNDFGAEAVECMDGYFKGSLADDLTQAFAHGIGAAFGECQAKNIFR